MTCLSLYCVLYWTAFFTLSTALTDVTQHPNWQLLDHNVCGSSSTDRIVGGKTASMGAYPWIANIGYKNPNDGKIQYLCGGALINKFYVVTAAHCVTDVPGGLKVARVRLGEHNLETNPDCEDGYCGQPVQDFDPVTIIIHESYNKPKFRNDISIIRLNKPAVYNDLVKPICMIQGELLNKNFTGELAEVAGWGIYDINKPQSSNVLQTVMLPVTGLEACKQAFRSFVQLNEQQICVGGIIGQDSCSGDSGGPLMKVESLNGQTKYYLIGLVSFGARHCGITGVPAIYTKIASYVMWILQNISS